MAALLGFIIFVGGFVLLLIFGVLLLIDVFIFDVAEPNPFDIQESYQESRTYSENQILSIHNALIDRLIDRNLELEYLEQDKEYGRTEIFFNDLYEERSQTMNQIELNCWMIRSYVREANRREGFTINGAGEVIATFYYSYCL